MGFAYDLVERQSLVLAGDPLPVEDVGELQIPSNEEGESGGHRHERAPDECFAAPARTTSVANGRSERTDPSLTDPPQEPPSETTRPPAASVSVSRKSPRSW